MGCNKFLFQYLPDSCCKTVEKDCGKKYSNIKGDTTAIEKQFYTKVSMISLEKKFEDIY